MAPEGARKATFEVLYSAREGMKNLQFVGFYDQTEVKLETEKKPTLTMVEERLLPYFGTTDH